LTYGLYELLGGTGLVLFKVLVVVGLALLLLRLSSTGSRWRIPVACTALALLAMSIRLLLQPATVSYVFLAVTLLLVMTEGSSVASGSAARRSESLALPPWPLWLLFVIWANLDSWFLLGLGTVALVWLGQSLEEPSAAQGRVRFL